MTEISDPLDRAPERRRDNVPWQSPYLTIPEVAALARCEHKAIRNAIHAGALPAFRPAQRLLVREQDARAWIESRPVSRSAPAPRGFRARARRHVRVGSVARLLEIERGAIER